MAAAEEELRQTEITQPAVLTVDARPHPAARRPTASTPTW